MELSSPEHDPSRGVAEAGGQNKMVRTAGLEPARPEGRQILSLLCLPISPRPQTVLSLAPLVGMCKRQSKVSA